MGLCPRCASDAFERELKVSDRREARYKLWDAANELDKMGEWDLAKKVRDAAKRV